MTVREAISRVKKELKEVNADSRMTNKFVYSKLISKASLLIQRESDVLKLYNMQGIHQIIPCVTLKEVPAIDEHCSITSDVTIFRSCNKLPEIYTDTYGPIISSVRTLDRNKEITIVSLNYLLDNRADSDSKFDKNIYGFYENGYLYIEKKIPVKVEAFFVDDVSKFKDCECSKNDSSPCTRFLDSKWHIPRKLEDSVISLVVQDLGNAYKRLPEQSIIDKNPNT